MSVDQRNQKNFESEKEFENHLRRMKNRRNRKRFRRTEIIFATLFIIFAIVIAIFAHVAVKDESPAKAADAEKTVETVASTTEKESGTLQSTESTKPTETKTTEAAVTKASETAVTESSQNVSGTIYIPSWIHQDFLTPNPINRPTTPISKVKNIVIHWVANPGSSAKDNRDYFECLSDPAANPEHVSASAHFVVGLKGEIVQCIPVEEVAYANYPRNNDTISIEVCHPDWNGQFNSTTYWSVIRLAAYLCEQYHLTGNDLLRHHDVSGKDCPKYYVEHPDAWEQMKKAVNQFMTEHPDIKSELP